MMGTKKLADTVGTGVTAVKKADGALRLSIALTAAAVAIGLLTLAAVLVSRVPRVLCGC